jgi:endonuclease YncB( thermonuclease family)
MRFALLFVLILSAGCAPTPPPVVGPATVIDGDTLRIGRREIRLWGVDAPELEQVCQGPTGAYSCGLVAKRALAAHINAKPVTCSGNEIDRYERLVARCKVDDSDIGATLVRKGLVVRYARYAGPTYMIEERAARHERLGIWAGAFTEPAEWRRGHRGTEALPYNGRAAWEG